MTEQIQFDRQKLKAAIHHVCGSVDPADLGRIKLHRVLFLADMLTYLEHGQPMTGAEYRRQQFGPAVKDLDWALGELAREGKVEARRIVAFGVPAYRFDLVARPAPDALTGQETALLDEVVSHVCGRASRAISDLDETAAWRSLGVGETIPYFAAFLLVPCEITDADVAWAEREARRILSPA